MKRVAYLISGGILRNMSSYIAVHEDHRRTLRRTGVYQLLLRQLGSSSLTVVSNACGSLWNLSARCAEDQQRLRDLGAVALLRSLVNSKHKMIAMGSTAALKNLLVPRGTAGGVRALERLGVNHAASPGLHGRRQRSLDRDFERHSDIGEFTGHPRQPHSGTASQHSNGWLMSSSAGGNLFGGRAVVADQVEEPNWRIVVDPAVLKAANVGAAAGSLSFTHGAERTFFDSQSVDSSPTVHRRVPPHGISAAVSSSLDYGQPVRSQTAAAYKGWSGSVMMPNGRSDTGFDHLSRRMERVHFTDLPDCSQDEPINFSMKYKESADASDVQIVKQTSSPDAGSRFPATQQPVLNSPLTRFHVSRQSLPNGCSDRLDFGRSGYSKPVFAGSGGVPFDAQKFVAAYGRSSIDVERPTNYSLQYAENYEDDDCAGGHYSEQPIDYSTRYMEPPQTCRPAVFRPERDEHCGLYADTVKTFCTEGTPLSYQSTATSMTDLSNTRVTKNPDTQSHRRTHSSDDLDVDEVQDFSRKYSEPQMDHEDRASAGYRWPQQHVEVSSYSHGGPATNDTGTSSPGDQPLKYCVEGTPPNFSHSSSVNSLRVDGAGKNESVPTANPTSALNAEPSAGTPTSAFSKTTEKFPPSQVVDSCSPTGSSGKPEGPRGGVVETTDAAHGKTVTFDVESNQVEQTPLMFSRSSSLGSLSSFDVRSVHSSVVSEYSVRASQVVSPSELPDSPCNTMPPSPSKSSQPAAFFGPDPVKSEDESSNRALDSNDVNLSSLTADTSALTVQPAFSSEQSSPVHYCFEGDNMSCRTSLSALTCDGERIRCGKETCSLAPEDGKTAEDQSATTARVPCDDKTENDGDGLDDVDFPVNEDDEARLAECINLGMPPPKHTKASLRMTRSCSDGDHLPQRSDFSFSAQTPTVLSSSTAAASTSCSKVESMVGPSEPPAGVQSAEDGFGFDSPRKFATEDTPLNFSQSGSLSDLSSVGGGAAGSEQLDMAEGAMVTKLNSTTAAPDDDSDASLSDDDVPGGDELLSYLIESAMPKKRQNWKPVAVQANNVRGRPPVGAPPTTDGTQRPASRSVEPPAHRPHSNPSEPREFHGAHNHLTDSRRQHELTSKTTTEPTSSTTKPALQIGPLHSDISVLKPPAFSWTAEPSDDQMLSYAVEGTPDSYSRDRSPSSQRNPNPLVSRSLSKAGDERQSALMSNVSCNSSLSSLSLDSSLNAEPTAEENALLQECINAALPKSRGRKSSKKASGHRQPLRTSPSGSSESSLKRRPVNLQSAESKNDPNMADESESKEVSVSEAASGSIIIPPSDPCDIMQESLPDVGLSDLTLDNESLPSGPSTEANNTVIYVGPALLDVTQSPLMASVVAEPSDVTAARDDKVIRLTSVADSDTVFEVSAELMSGKVTDAGKSGPTTTDLSCDQVCIAWRKYIHCESKKTVPLFKAYNFRSIEQIFTRFGINQVSSF